jgi:hypothetical protein
MSVRVAGAPQTTQALAPREETLLGHRRELSAYVRERLAKIGTDRTWRKGTVILRAGEVPPFVLVIELGQVRYSRLGRRGAEDLMSLPEDALIGLPSVVAQRQQQQRRRAGAGAGAAPRSSAVRERDKLLHQWSRACLLPRPRVRKWQARASSVWGRPPRYCFA